MDGFRTVYQLQVRMLVGLMTLMYQDFWSSWCLNEEGMALLRFRERVVNDPFGALSSWNESVGGDNPCLWFGVECAEGNVVSLYLKDLSLEGTLAPEISHLSRIKVIVLRNNSFYGVIPVEIGDLEELEMLDLGCNNFSGPFPPKYGNKISILLLDNIGPFIYVSPELKEVMALSEVRMSNDHLQYSLKESSYDRKLKASASGTENGLLSLRRIIRQAEDKAHRRELRHESHDKENSSSGASTAIPSPESWGSSSTLLPPPERPSSSSEPPLAGTSNTTISTAFPDVKPKSSTSRIVVILPTVIGGLAVLALVLCVFLWRRKRTIRPWVSGLSGQLQKAFVAGNGISLTGVPKIKRSELETACEDFSNVICSSSIGTIYKGTLSSGVEVAVMSYAVASSRHWSKDLETQFRKKVDTLSKMNHNNFVNLIGHSEEEEPFTRMMVFEYAPNGTLFEHLHIREAEHLNWGMRLRVAMGMAYCLQHMHELTPTIVHGNLNSSIVYLSEDYATKVSDFGFADETIAAMSSCTMNNSNRSSGSLGDDVYSFGLVLLELMTGQIPQDVGNGSLEDWCSQFLEGQKPVEEMADPMLRCFDGQRMGMIIEVVKSCVCLDPQQKPRMGEVTARLSEITAISPTDAAPRLSPSWWAELEQLSINGS